MVQKFKQQNRRSEVFVKKRRLTPSEIIDQNVAIIREAIRTGTVDRYVWMVKLRVTLDSRYVEDRADDGDNRIGCWPGERFPVVPLRWDLYGDWVGFLLQFFRDANRNIDEFYYLAVVELSLLETYTPGRFYNWGEL